MKPNRKSFFLTIALVMILSLVAAFPCAAAVPNPTPIDLGVLPGTDHVFSSAYAVNNAGQVVGKSWENDTYHTKPFIWQNGVMTQLPLPENSAEGVAMSINDAGWIAGYYLGEDSHYQACLWKIAGNVWKVTALGAPTFTYEGIELIFIDSLAVKINDAGQVLVGASGVVFEGQTYNLAVGAIWQDGAWSFLTDSDGLPQGADGWLLKMNEKGQVLFTKENSDEQSYDLWVWDGETASFLVEHIGWANLNNSGQIVGVYYNSSQTRNENFTYDMASKTLKTLPVTDFAYSLVNINDKGQVLVAYPTTRVWDGNGVFIGTTELGITSFDEWSVGAIVTSLGSVDGYVNSFDLNFNANGEVSGDGYSNGSAFYASAASGVVPLYDLVAGSALQVTAMNDSGLIIGYSGDHAVLWGEAASTDSVLDFSGAIVTRKGKTVTISVKTAVTNPGSESALNTFVNAVTLGGSAPSKNLPLKIGMIKPGASKSISLTFKDVPAGEVTLNIQGTCSLGSFFTTQTVTVP